MQLGLSVIVLAIVIAVGYCVAFSLVYPLVNGGIVSLCVILGLLTALMIVGAWKAVTKK